MSEELDLTTQSPGRAQGGLLQALPGIARIASGAAVRTAGWSIGAYARAGARVLRAAESGESTSDLLRETGEELRKFAREMLGVANGRDAQEPAAVADARGDADALRERGAELLRLSADVRYKEHTHPAYERILDDLAPDEGRILRLLMREGAQPAVDVRSSKTLNVTSQLVAPGLSMIGAHAGCRYLDRVPAYLNNLYRLGLIWFSREPLEDPVRYQVLEAQPDVLEAMRSRGRGRTVRRSILLTPFGESFCAVCMPPGITNGSEPDSASESPEPAGGDVGRSTGELAGSGSAPVYDEGPPADSTPSAAGQDEEHRDGIEDEQS